MFIEFIKQVFFLLNKLRRRDQMQGLPSILSLFLQQVK